MYQNQLQAFDEELQVQAGIMAAAIKYELRQGQWRLVLNEVPFLGGENPTPRPSLGLCALVRSCSRHRKGKLGIPAPVHGIPASSGAV